VSNPTFAEPCRSGPELRARRQSLRISQGKLASALGINQQALSSIERGVRPGDEELMARATAWLRAQIVRPAVDSRAEDRQAHPLLLAMEARGWTVSDLADRHARHFGGRANRGKIWKWVHWGQVPDKPNQLALAAVFGIPADTLLVAQWPGWLPEAEAVDPEAVVDLEGIVAALDAAAGGVQVNRREFLTVSSVAVERMAHGLKGIDPPVGELAGASASGVAGSYEALLPELRARESSRGGRDTLAVINGQLVSAREWLRQGLGQAAETRMLRVCAELGRIAGWAALDADLPGTAERYLVLALGAARRGRAPVTAMNAAKTMGLMLLEDGRPAEADTLLAAARHAARGRSPRLQAMIAVRAARMKAATGDSDGSATLVDQARSLFDLAESRATGEEHAEHAELAYFDASELAAQTAASHRLLGRHQDTLRLLDQVLPAHPDSRPRDRTTYRLWAAEAALGVGDVERACAELAAAVPDIAAVYSARNRIILTSVHQRLHAYSGRAAGLAAVREVDALVGDLLP
jgi:DNA-binding XRE family transcriptional regulator